MLTKIQLQERAKRKRNSCRGLCQAKGTQPYLAREPESFYKPFGLATPSLFSLSNLMSGLAFLATMPFMLRSRRRAEQERLKGKI